MARRDADRTSGANSSIAFSVKETGIIHGQKEA